MQIKFKRSIKEYDYLVMFDLASKTTGVCVFDLRTMKPVETYILQVKGEYELPMAELQVRLVMFFEYLEYDCGYDLSKVLVFKEAPPTQVRGAQSTIQTFIALAKSHAILDIVLFNNGIDCYDYTGIYPISTHCYCRKLMNLSKQDKITKDVVRDCVYASYGKFKELTYDEADAVMLAKTFLEVKWNNDLDEEIRKHKKHKKNLKMKNAIEAEQKEIERLENLRIIIK